MEGLIKKGLVLSLILSVFFAVTATIALASGYNNPLQYNNDALYPQGPHGGYTTSTNKCKDCHAVHLATGTYLLTRADSANQVCDFCHSETSGLATKRVSLNTNGHGVDTNTPDPIVAPDDTTPTPYTIPKANWGCVDCHSVHNSQTVKLADEPSTKLLKADPNPGKAYFYYNPSLIDTTTRQSPQKLAAWCSACHNANFGYHKTPKQYYNGTETINVYGHDVAEDSATLDTTTGYALNVNPDNGNQGPNCKQCHQADGGSTFPHESTAPDLLMSAVNSTKSNLDVVCISCHNTASLP